MGVRRRAKSDGASPTVIDFATDRNAFDALAADEFVLLNNVGDETGLLSAFHVPQPMLGKQHAERLLAASRWMHYADALRGAAPVAPLPTPSIRRSSRRDRHATEKLRVYLARCALSFFAS